MTPVDHNEPGRDPTGNTGQARAWDRFVAPWLRWPSRPRGPEQNDGDGGGGREVLVRILIAIVWFPIQITLSLIFATGGIFFVLIFGVVLGPFAGIYFLVRHLLRDSAGQAEQGAVDDGSPP